MSEWLAGRSNRDPPEFAAFSAEISAAGRSAATGGVLVIDRAVVVRRAHRTILARVIAVCLLILAASPVTAPFSVIDGADFGHSQPAGAHHPAHDMAEAPLRVVPQLIVTTLDVTPVTSAATCDDGDSGIRRGPIAAAPRPRGTVLRL